MNRRVMRRLPPALTLVILLSSFAFPIVRASVGKEPAAPTAIRITPPAPVFEDAKRLDELAARRKRVAETIGSKGILVMFSAEPRVYTNDVDYQFRQENNLYYLMNLGQKGATLVLMPGNQQVPEVLFLPRRNPARETWTGHMYSPQEAGQLSGIKEIWEAGEFGPFMSALAKHEARTALSLSFPRRRRKKRVCICSGFLPTGKAKNIVRSRSSPQPGRKSRAASRFRMLHQSLPGCVCESHRWNSS